MSLCWKLLILTPIGAMQGYIWGEYVGGWPSAVGALLLGAAIGWLGSAALDVWAGQS